MVVPNQRIKKIPFPRLEWDRLCLIKDVAYFTAMASISKSAPLGRLAT